MEKLAPLIVTLQTDAASFEIFDRLRRAHFPPARNFLQAHITLFHHLPGELLAEVERDLEKICAETETFPLVFSEWRFMGRGVAMKIESDVLLGFRARLAGIWREHLTPQDRQKFQPHITIQNKVEPDAARSLFEELANGWNAAHGTAEGVSLWHYRGGPWETAGEFTFRRAEN